jgi:hypothetical protein
MLYGDELGCAIARLGIATYAFSAWRARVVASLARV